MNHSLLTRTPEILIVFVIVCLFSCVFAMNLIRLQSELNFQVIAFEGRYKDASFGQEFYN